MATCIFSEAKQFMYITINLEQHALINLDNINPSKFYSKIGHTGHTCLYPKFATTSFPVLFSFLEGCDSTSSSCAETAADDNANKTSKPSKPNRAVPIILDIFFFFSFRTCSSNAASETENYSRRRYLNACTCIEIQSCYSRISKTGNFFYCLYF